MRPAAPAAVLALLAWGAPLDAQVMADVDGAGVRRALERGLETLPEVEARWRASLAPESDQEASWRELFGYDPPGTALSLAYLAGFLHAEEGREEDAALAAGLLARMADYREQVPAALAAARVEYADGLPAVPNFFHLADYAETWARVRGSSAVDDATRAKVDGALAGSADFVFVFPEWGRHNRALLRAVGLAWAAEALPGHPRASDWRRMGAALAEDSLGGWEVEDAQVYHPIWLGALLRYAEVADRPEVFTSLPVRWYLRYFLELLDPRGAVPEFGDGWWDGSLARYYLCLEWGAARLGDPELAWAARRVYGAMGPDPGIGGATPGVGRALLFARLAHRADPTLAPREPAVSSGPVLDDVLGKKLVFRSGWGADDRYLLLNYRDEGDWGITDREYLRRTLAVEHEKMHHGHSDEGAVLLFMDQGAVLLHDAGYRDAAPSGPFGAWRADLYHDRLVGRRGRPAEGQSLLAFLRAAGDDGRYRPTRTQLVDCVVFEHLTYARVRVHDETDGWTWDRILLLPDDPPVVVVVDSVLSPGEGEFTFAPLWAVGEVLDEGPGWARGRTTAVGRFAVPATRELWIGFPGAGGAPGRFRHTRHRRGEEVVTRARTVQGGARATFVSVLRSVPPGSGGDDLARAVTPLAVEGAPGGLALAVAGGGRRWTFLLKLDLAAGLAPDRRPRYGPEAGRLVTHGLASDGDLAALSREGEQARWCAVNMTHVLVDGAQVHAARPMQVFQTTGRSDVVGRVKWRRWEGVVGGAADD